MCLWVVVGKENHFCGQCVSILNVTVESNKKY